MAGERKTFFRAQAENRRSSWLLFAACCVLLAAVGASIGGAYGSWEVGLVAGLAFAVVQYLFAYYAGPSLVLGVSGAKEIQKYDDPQLFNVVEEMAIAAGLPRPRVYLIEDSAPNAFATGRDPKHAMVAITTGLRDKLSRDELQGVMAHEMSHVRNLDIRFMVLMSIMVGSVALLSDFFLRSLRHRRLAGSSGRSGKGNAAAAVFVIVALLLAIVAPLFAKLLQLAVSREREYLADSSAVELTRNPEGLASALEKISNDKEVLEVANRATQHLYIVNPIKSLEARSSSVFSTHPPIKERIARIRSFNRSAPAKPVVVS